MPLELVTVRTADGVDLDGVLHMPPGDTSSADTTFLVVHGLGWNFYQGPSRWLPPLLTRSGIPCLSINMRDHTTRKVQRFDLSQHDLRAGIDELERRFDREVVLLAHGFGCNKAISYPALSGDQRVGRFVLATLGGARAYRPELWQRVLRRAAVLQGHVLVVQGAIDMAIDGRARADDLVAAAPSALITTVLLDGADHYFNDRHDELAECILGWLPADVSTPNRGIQRTGPRLD